MSKSYRLLVEILGAAVAVVGIGLFSLPIALIVAGCVVVVACEVRG